MTKTNKIAEEKARQFFKKGFRVDATNGLIYSNTNNLVGSLNGKGYIAVSACIDKKQLTIKAHHLIFYSQWNYVPEQINHIDHNKTNNKISNLEASDPRHNTINRMNKGKNYYWDKSKDSFALSKTFYNKVYKMGYTKDERIAKIIGCEIGKINTLHEIMEFKKKFRGLRKSLIETLPNQNDLLSL